MPARNAQILILATLVCLLCFVQAKRPKYAGRIGAAIETIEQNYVDPVKGDDLYQAAMKGLLKLDPYSEFIPATEYTEFQATIEQQFGGVGILIEGPPTSRRLTVVAPLANTPAYEAGIQPGDEIVRINGQSTDGMTSDDARDKMRGIVGTTVNVAIQRANQAKEIELTLTRADIKVDSVVGDHLRPDSKWNYFLREQPEIAYIRVSLFGERTADEFREALLQIKPAAKSLIIDLRFNPGGVLSAAVDMCDMLLSKGRIVSTKGRRLGFDTQAEADADLVLPLDIPIIILQNDQSASASEIMAACLQDNGRALIAGQRSFGKGTVQQVFEIDHASTAIKFTTARYFRPSGANIHRTPEMQPQDVWGVSPDE
ncbi:MAG: PDZ domain-containing protein, partial [Pirellulaceae bacterium]|nr:PDZ domain-containing protein [Pirellulaceae bacterium]